MRRGGRRHPGQHPLHPTEHDLLPRPVDRDDIFMVLVGGLGTFEGPIIGAIILFVLQDQFGNGGVWYLVGLGATAILFALFVPRGDLGTTRTASTSRWPRSATGFAVNRRWPRRMDPRETRQIRRRCQRMRCRHDHHGRCRRREGGPFSLRQSSPAGADYSLGGHGLSERIVATDDVDAIDHAVHDAESGAVIKLVLRMAQAQREESDKWPRPRFAPSRRTTTTSSAVRGSRHRQARRSTT